MAAPIRSRGTSLVLTWIPCAILCSILTACASRDDCGTEGPSLAADLTALVAESTPVGHVVGVAYDDLSETRIEVQADVVMHAASTMKVPVMIELFRRVDSGDLRLDQGLILANHFRSIVDGSPYSLSIDDDSDRELYERVGRRITLGELCTRMIDRSSNLATNVLIDLLDAKRVQTTIESLGTKYTLVLRGVEDQKAYDRGLSNRTCARDMATLFAAIATNRAASSRSCARMLEILEGQKHRSMLPAGLPSGTRIAHKTGQITKIHHDVGLVRRADGSAFVLAVLTKGFAEEAASAAVGAKIAKRCYRR